MTKRIMKMMIMMVIIIPKQEKDPSVTQSPNKWQTS